MKQILKTLTVSLIVLALALPLVNPAEACVGKSLLIATTGSPQQDILAQMLALLIAERTGTTVKVVPFANAAAAHEALTKADLDIQVQYSGQGLVEVLKKPAVADRNAVFQAVKESYNQDLNLVWLAPFGFDGSGSASGVPSQAAPVVRKDTLKKFPALSRLINKLGGSIDAATMQKLEAEAKTKPAQEVARAFLKAGKYI